MQGGTGLLSLDRREASELVGGHLKMVIIVLSVSEIDVGERGSDEWTHGKGGSLGNSELASGTLEERGTVGVERLVDGLDPGGGAGNTTALARLLTGLECRETSVTRTNTVDLDQILHEELDELWGEKLRGQHGCVGAL